MVPLTIPQGNYNFPRGTNKIQFFDEISTSGKMKGGGWVGGGGGLGCVLVRDRVGGHGVGGVDGVLVRGGGG